MDGKNYKLNGGECVGCQIKEEKIKLMEENLKDLRLLMGKTKA